MTAPTPQPGDEVLIRARVEAGHPVPEEISVQLWTKIGPFSVPVRRDLVAEVIPAERTKTHRGHTVAATREAIAMTDRLIEYREPHQTPAAELLIEAMREMRAGLVADLEAVGVSVEEPS